MMMKKSFILAAAATALLIGGAWAESWLWWMVEDPTDESSAALTFDYAKVKVTPTAGESSYLTMATPDGSVGTTEFAPSPAPGTYVESYALFQGAAGSTYLVELYLGGNLIAQSSTEYTYEEMGDYVFDRDTTIGALAPLSVSSFTSVPEPTGGLLMLFGAALLALRRKNRRD